MTISLWSHNSVISEKQINFLNAFCSLLLSTLLLLLFYFLDCSPGFHFLTGKSDLISNNYSDSSSNGSMMYCLVVWYCHTQTLLAVIAVTSFLLPLQLMEQIKLQINEINIVSTVCVHRFSTLPIPLAIINSTSESAITLLYEDIVERGNLSLKEKRFPKRNTDVKAANEGGRRGE